MGEIIDRNQGLDCSCFGCGAIGDQIVLADVHCKLVTSCSRLENTEDVYINSSSISYRDKHQFLTHFMLQVGKNLAKKQCCVG